MATPPVVKFFLPVCRPTMQATCRSCQRDFKTFFRADNMASAASDRIPAFVIDTPGARDNKKPGCDVAAGQSKFRGLPEAGVGSGQLGFAPTLSNGL
jgi:hypothetical protein